MVRAVKLKTLAQNRRLKAYRAAQASHARILVLQADVRLRPSIVEAVHKAVFAQRPLVEKTPRAKQILLVVIRAHPLLEVLNDLREVPRLVDIDLRYRSQFRAESRKLRVELRPHKLSKFADNLAVLIDLHSADFDDFLLLLEALRWGLPASRLQIKNNVMHFLIPFFINFATTNAPLV